MRIINRNSSNKKLFIILACIGGVLVIAGTAIALLLMTPGLENQRLTDEIDKTSSVKEDQVVPENTGKDTDPSLPDKNTGSSDNFQPNPGTPTPETAPEKPNLLRAESTGSAVKVVATFQSMSSGYCELTMTNGSSSISRNAQIVIGSSYYSCSFSIPLSEISTGSWTTTVNHKVGNASTPSDTKVIEVR